MVNELTIEFEGFKAIALNNTQKFGRGHVYKTEKTHEFNFLVSSVLSKNHAEIMNFNKFLKSGEFYLVVDYLFYFKVFTKKNKIGKNFGDVDNLIKPIQDLIFKRLIYDDSQILTITASKIHSENPKTKVTLRAVSLDTILF